MSIRMGTIITGQLPLLILATSRHRLPLGKLAPQSVLQAGDCQPPVHLAQKLAHWPRTMVPIILKCPQVSEGIQLIISIQVICKIQQGIMSEPMATIGAKKHTAHLARMVTICTAVT